MESKDHLAFPLWSSEDYIKMIAGHFCFLPSFSSRHWSNYYPNNNYTNFFILFYNLIINFFFFLNNTIINFKKNCITVNSFNVSATLKMYIVYEFIETQAFTYCILMIKIV